MVGKSTHLHICKFAITNIREKPENFFYCSTRALTLVSAITLQTKVPLQKFPFLFIFIILWLEAGGIRSCPFFLHGLARANNPAVLFIYYDFADKLLSHSKLSADGYSISEID